MVQPLSWTLWLEVAPRALLGVAVAVALLAAVTYVSFLVARRLLDGAPVSLRWSGAAVVATALLVGLFFLLGLAHAFRWWVALPVLLALAAAARGWLDRDGSGTARLLEDARAAGRFARSVWGSPDRWALLSLAVIAARAARGLVAPPLAWDTLTYHLVKAAQWVSAGRFLAEPAPDAWSYYAWLPAYGDILWAWALLPMGGDGLLALAGLLAWLAGVLGAYAASRVLGAAPSLALLVALALFLTPAATTTLTSGYVDVLLLSLFTLSSALFLHFLRAPRLPEAVLAAAGFGLMAGVKSTALAVLLVALAFFLARVATAPWPWRERLRAVGLCALAALAGVQPYLTAWVEKGSPIYPVPLALRGHLLLPGNAQWVEVHSRGGTATFDGLFHAIVFSNLGAGREHLGLGPVGLLVLGLSAWGLWRCLRGPGTRLPAAFLGVCAVALVLSQTGELNRALWTEWVANSVRYLLPAFGALALLASVPDRPWVRALWALAVLCNAWLSVPRGWGAVDAAALGALLVPAAAAGLALAVGHVLAWHRRQWLVGGLLAGLAGLGAFSAVATVRRAYRYGFYEASVRGHSYELHSLGAGLVGAWPVWAFLDTPEGHRVAVAAGWDGTGHNWFRAPLFGSRLQNTVLYVPPTADGSVVDSQRHGELRRAADFEAWLRRLVEGRVDHVVLLSPLPPVESGFVREHPELFQRVAQGLDWEAAAYRLDAEKARAALE
ncbi:hypothetical protein P2318_34540 [Myxococcaceae bacterium GXIMD 01537]